MAEILEGELDTVIQDWLSRVEKEPDLTCISLNFEERTGHLPLLLHDVIARSRLDAGTRAPISTAASHHGDLRRNQGYTLATAVEESRLLQVSIFSMLHKGREAFGFQHSASSHCNDRGRGGCAIETADPTVHGRGYSEGQGQLTRFLDEARNRIAEIEYSMIGSPPYNGRDIANVSQGK